MRKIVYEYESQVEVVPLHTRCTVVTSLWENFKNTQNSFSSLIQKFIRYNTFSVVGGRKKQRMKTESPALAERRETSYHKEEGSANTDLEFSCWFSVVVLTYVFASFVSTAPRLA